MAIARTYAQTDTLGSKARAGTLTAAQIAALQKRKEQEQAALNKKSTSTTKTTSTLTAAQIAALQKRKEQEQAALNKKSTSTTKTTNLLKSLQPIKPMAQKVAEINSKSKTPTPTTKTPTKTNTPTSSGSKSKNTSSSSSSSNTPAAKTPTSTTVTPEAVTNSLADYINTVRNYAGDQDLTKPTYYDYINVEAPKLRTLDDIAKLYGIEYDYNKILDILTKGVEANYDAQYLKQQENEDAYYRNAASSQNTLEAALNSQRSAAVQSGMNKGMLAANMLSAALGNSQNFADAATTLSQQRSQLAANYGAALQDANTNAFNTSNELKQAMAKYSQDLYDSEIQKQISQYDYNAQTNVANAGVQQGYMSAQAQLGAALASVLGSAANNYTSNQTSRYAADVAAAAQRDAANAAAAATKYAAYQNYLGQSEYAKAYGDAAKQYNQNQPSGLSSADEIPKASSGTANKKSGGSSGNFLSKLPFDIDKYMSIIESGPTEGTKRLTPALMKIGKNLSKIPYKTPDTTLPIYYK